MRSDVARDLSASAQDFVDIVWPIVSPWCSGGQILPVETTTDDDLRSALDRLAGIDAWQICDEAGRMRGIASRIQWIGCYPSFTIRKSRNGNPETELKKRMAAMDAPGNWLLPALTIQAYLKGRSGSPALIVCCNTRDLYNYVSMYPEEITLKTNERESGRPVDFLVAWVDLMIKHQIRVRHYPAVLPSRGFRIGNNRILA